MIQVLFRSWHNSFLNQLLLFRLQTVFMTIDCSLIWYIFLFCFLGELFQLVLHESLFYSKQRHIKKCSILISMLIVLVAIAGDMYFDLSKNSVKTLGKKMSNFIIIALHLCHGNFDQCVFWSCRRHQGWWSHMARTARTTVSQSIYLFC
jgi:hypothetical protein